MPRLFGTGYVTPLTELDSMAKSVLGIVPHSWLLPGCRISVFIAGSVPLPPHVLGNWPASRHANTSKFNCTMATGQWTMGTPGTKASEAEVGSPHVMGRKLALVRSPVHYANYFAKFVGMWV